ncbi:Ig-like domain-containing protein [Brevibacillus porteri]|uniref:Ig-like domain-containing protein n=1 Tax=Brevibacillus porteri TaxID=2126350 RepID=UPI0036409098
MNKKVVLSVLSTAVVASMATSAFAAPKAGIYMGGNVKKYYSTDVVLNMTKEARKSYLENVRLAGPNAVVQVDNQGRGAFLQEILDEGRSKAYEEKLVKEDFIDLYDVVTLNGTTNGTEDAKSKVDPAPTGDLKVDSVSAVDALTVQVKFNKEVRLDSAQNAANYKLNGAAIPGALKYELQADKKTVLITLAFDNRMKSGDTYLLTVSGIIGVDQKPLATAYNQAISFTDTTAPTLGAVTYEDINTAKVSFSEPMVALAGSSIRIYDETGADVTADGLGPVVVSGNAIANGGKTITLDLTNAAPSKTYTVKVYGAVDASGNAAGTKTFTVVKTSSDITKPLATAITATGLNTFKVTFNEKVVKDAKNNGRYGTVSIDGQTAFDLVVGPNVAELTMNETGTELTVKLVNSLDAKLHTVAVNNFVDASLNKQETAFSKLVNFSADTTAPKVTGTAVQTVNGTDSIVVTFDEEIKKSGSAPTNAISGGKVVSENVEYAVTAFGASNLYDPDGDGKSNMIAITLPAPAKSGAYTVTLDAGVVEDLGGLKNTSGSLSFTYNPTTSSSKPKVVDADSNPNNGATGVKVQAAGTPNEITVEFNKEVTDATALNVANYTVDNETVFEKAVFVGDKKTVKLTLKQEAIKATANYSFQVKNVADAAGNVMDAVTFIQPFTENVAPTVKTAAVTGVDTLSITFSESMDAGSLADNNDFELLIGGVKAAGTLSVSGTGATYTVTRSTYFTPDDLNKDIQIKVLPTTNATDASAIKNALKGDVVVPVSK